MIWKLKHNKNTYFIIFYHKYWKVLEIQILCIFSIWLSNHQAHNPCLVMKIHVFAIELHPSLPYWLSKSFIWVTKLEERYSRKSIAKSLQYVISYPFSNFILKCCSLDEKKILQELIPQYYFSRSYWYHKVMATTIFAFRMRKLNIMFICK